MARIITVILSLTLVCAESLSAQIIPWYLRDENKKAENTASETLPEKLTESPVDTSQLAEKAPETGDGSAELMLVMPFKQDSVLNTSALDFYCGALLAARDLGNEGKNLKLTAVDVDSETDSSLFGKAKVIVGPFGRNGIKEILHKCPPQASVISALDAEPYEDSLSAKLIQIPTFVKYRHSALAEWFSAQADKGRQLIVLSNQERGRDSFSEEAFKYLTDNGIRYITAPDTTLIANSFTENDSIAVLIASETEHYLLESIRAISALSLRRYNIATFCSAKVRNNETLNVDFLHNCNVHLCTNYHIDYKRPEVKTFVLAYRSLFGCEPGQFAFHGYDLVKYTGEAISEYGRNWTNMLPQMPANGLQTGFVFKPEQNSGRMRNTAAIRIEYCRDYSVVTH